MRPVPSGRHRARLLAGTVAMLVMAGTGLALLLPTASSADSLDSCTATHGAIVAVDFGHWSGPVVRGCDANPTTGMNLLTNGGFTTAGTVHDGPGFICRIGSTGFDGGTQYPTPTDEPCTVTPPASAYWSFWIASPGHDTWTYSPLGAFSDVPVDGEVEAWVFGATDVGGTMGQPNFTPSSVRAGGATAAPSPSGSPTSAPAGPTDGPPANLAAATAYLVGQLTDGDHVFNADWGVTDYYETVQVGIALAATGRDDATLSKVVAYLSAHVSDAIFTAGPDSPPDPLTVGNIALLVEITGGDPHDVGGQDLIKALTNNVCTAAGSGGNCTGTGSFYGAFSPTAQAIGILALARGGVTVPPSAVSRLGELQCADGGFAGSMIAPGDFCDPENDVTGLAVQVLTAAGGADAAVDRAHDALVAAQQTDGGFLPATGAAASDTATTAFDAEALTTLGVTAGATAATSFIAARQQDDGGFAIDANTPGSDLYAASDALPALVGATLTTLSHPITGGGPTSPPPTPTPTPTTTPTVTPTPTPTATPTSTPTLPPGGPNLTTGTRYLVAPSNLIDGHYYQLFPGFADFGLTIDGAYSLAATGLDDSALAKIVAFLNTRGKDGSDRTVDDWTGIGTPFVSGGSLGKEALLAEVVGANPRAFGGHDLIAALDASICGAATGGTDLSCAGSGNYVYAQSTFSQALGIMAQIRAGDAAAAASPIAYLESLQHHDGSFPSLIPSTGDSDVDSTAMAVMALDLVPGERAAMAVDKGIAWIATQQEADGGFPGAAGDSVNSAALAIQGLSVQAGGFPRQIAAALGFLAGLQNSDGGFNVAADGQPGSDVRASTQAIGGAVGTSFGTLSRDLSGLPTPPPTQSPTQKPTHKPTQKPTKQPTPTRAPVGPTVTVTRTATVTTTVTPTATATATPTGAPTLAPLPAFGASGSPSATGATAVADASDNTKPMNRLWWVVFAVTFALAALVAGLFLRRRRIYPSRPGAKHAGAATKAGS